jgi:competence protein ComEA
MLTTTEKQSLALTLAFLLVGGGIKACQRSQVRLGPFTDSNPAGTDSLAATGAILADSGVDMSALPLSPIAASDPGSHSRPGQGPDRRGHHHDLQQDRDQVRDEAREPGIEAGSALVESHPMEAAFTKGAEPSLLAAASSSLSSPASPTSLSSPEPRKPKRPKSNTRKGKSAPAAKVSLNRASAAELAEVPGIGPKTALAILEYRKSRGPFMDLRELVHVKGIGEKKLERIKPFLVISPSRETPILEARLVEGGESAEEDEPEP